MKAKKFNISGLNNSKEISHIEQAIHSHEGINAVRVDTQANTVTVDYDEGRYKESDIANYINQTGLKVNTEK
jgi:copper chaperone CopZ